MIGQSWETGEMGRRRWAIPAGAIGAALLIAATAGIIGGTLLAMREGDNGRAKSSASVTVFIRDSATAAQVIALEAKIRATPGVETYEYFTKEETIRRILDGRPEVMMGSFAAAASYVIHVKDAAQVYAVAQQFFYDPAVNSDPGTRNGVFVSTRVGVFPARTGIVGRVLTAGGPAPGAARPYPASEVKVIDSSGRVVAVVSSQPDAAFRVDLFPGDYTVEARPTAGNPWFRPEKVSVRAGLYSKVDIYAQIR